MKKREIWQLSLRNVFSSPVRSLLTVLGMAVGVGAILAVLTLGDAGKTQVRAEMTRLGIDRVWLSSGEGMRMGDAGELSQRLGVEAEEQIYLSAQAEINGECLTLPVIGCSENWLSWCGVETAKGRMLYPPEWNAASRAAMLGAKAAEKADASVGDRIFVGNVVFTLCGILENGGSFSRVSVEDALIVPVQTLAEWTDNRVHEVMMGVMRGTSPESTAAMAQQTLQRLRNTEVEAVTMQLQMDAADSVVTIFVDVLKWVALICVLVGGIGVMNILLVGVRERRREIGVMKSLGTTYAQIRLLFLMEALVYAVIGGILGILIGLGLIDLAGRSIGLSPQVRMGDCLLVGCVSLCAGLFFGVAPASRAARLSPVDALRQE